MGSKLGIADRIVNLVKLNLEPGGTFIEPFCGGCNVAMNLPQLTYRVKLYDYNKYLISFLKKLQGGYMPPLVPPTREVWDYHRRHLDEDPAITGEYGYLLGFRGAFYTSYCYLNKKDGDNYYLSKRASVLKTIAKIKDYELTQCSYTDIVLPEDKENTLIYCDPPYATSVSNDFYQKGVKHKDVFNHPEFWSWVKARAEEGYKIIVSELTAPEDFVSILDIPYKHIIGGGREFHRHVIERIYVLKGTEGRYKKPRRGIVFGDTNI